MGCGPLPRLKVGLHDRHRETSLDHTCFPHPIRPSATFPASRRRGSPLAKGRSSLREAPPLEGLPARPRRGRRDRDAEGVAVLKVVRAQIRLLFLLRFHSVDIQNLAPEPEVAKAREGDLFCI